MERQSEFADRLLFAFISLKMLPETNINLVITFLLAMTGYAGMTVVALYTIKRKVPRLFWFVVVLIILVHVIMVWNFRYGWQFASAVRNGYGGFIIFHSALLIIVVSTIVKEKTSKFLIRISFIIVSAGALGAVFRYEIVEIYKLPVLMCSIAGNTGLIWNYFNKNR